jgi:hypothetical protein
LGCCFQKSIQIFFCEKIGQPKYLEAGGGDSKI